MYLVTKTGNLYSTDTLAVNWDESFDRIPRELRKDKQGTTKAFPAGGGFACRLRDSAIVFRTKIWASAIDYIETNFGGYRLVPIGFSDRPVAYGYLLGTEKNGADRWNGWATPSFPLDQLDAVCEYFNAIEGDYGYDVSWEDGTFRWVETHDGTVEDEWSRSLEDMATITIEGQEVKVLSIGAGLCWEEWTQDELRKHHHLHHWLEQ